ncbi:MAG: type II toxin-antitoxin system HicA family toxin [Vulcanimicrobiaceae bacterium]
MTFHQLMLLVEEDGWLLVRITGSHRHYRHPGKPGIVTLPAQPGRDVAPNALNSVLKQARCID